MLPILIEIHGYKFID